MTELEQINAVTEAGTIAELAQRPTLFPIDKHEHDSAIALPPAWRIERLDTEAHGSVPRRPRGVSYVHDATSFVAAVKRRRAADVEPVIYADEEQKALVAILDDDAGEAAGWREYRVELALRATPEWNLWKSRDGALMSQEGFAEHVEAGLLELADPAPGVMLELAQTFHATVGAQFKGGHRLASGARQLTYDETIEASAGGAGEITLPERLKLVLAPFYGSARYEVGALFRFRLDRSQGLRLGYKLERPHEIERAAFADVRANVQSGLEETLVIAGPAPASTLGATP